MVDRYLTCVIFRRSGSNANKWGKRDSRVTITLLAKSEQDARRDAITYARENYRVGEVDHAWAMKL